MARAKKPAAIESTQPGSKAKVGPISRKELEDAIQQLNRTITQLEQTCRDMQSEQVEEITMLGPKALGRGVNSVVDFSYALLYAMAKRKRM